MRGTTSYFVISALAWAFSQSCCKERVCLVDRISTSTLRSSFPHFCHKDFFCVVVYIACHYVKETCDFIGDMSRHGDVHIRQININLFGIVNTTYDMDAT